MKYALNADCPLQMQPLDSAHLMSAGASPFQTARVRLGSRAGCPSCAWRRTSTSARLWKNKAATDWDAGHCVTFRKHTQELEQQNARLYNEEAPAHKHRNVETVLSSSLMLMLVVAVFPSPRTINAPKKSHKLVRSCLLPFSLASENQPKVKHNRTAQLKGKAKPCNTLAAARRQAQESKKGLLATLGTAQAGFCSTHFPLPLP